MSSRIVVSALFLLLTFLSVVKGQGSIETIEKGKCPVTIPHRAPDPPGEKLFGSGSAAWNGNLFVGGLWPNGTVAFQPNPDGSISMKFGWYRTGTLRGKLTITGRRLDAQAPPLGASIPSGYSDTGFQASGVIFPTEGCWEVTGKVGDDTLTFVTRVVKISQNR
jgi:hypothetical protein